MINVKIASRFWKDCPHVFLGAKAPLPLLHVKVKVKVKVAKKFKHCNIAIGSSYDIPIDIC